MKELTIENQSNPKAGNEKELNEKTGANNEMHNFTGDQIVRQNTENSQTKNSNRETANPKTESTTPHQKSRANTLKLPWLWKQNLPRICRNRRGRRVSGNVLEKSRVEENSSRGVSQKRCSPNLDYGPHRRKLLNQRSKPLAGRLSTSFSMLEESNLGSNRNRML